MSTILRVKLSFIFLLMASLAFSQRRDTVTYNYYEVGTETTLNIDFQHTELSILPSESDSIIIKTHIRVIPTNPKAPYAGIDFNNKQLDSTTIISTIAIGETIQPHNDLQAYSYIQIPKGVQLRIKSQYGIINLNAPTGKIKADIAYTNITADSLASFDELDITADYSSIILDSMKHRLEIEGKNTNLKANYIKTLISKTQFSVFDIANSESIESHSYTDKFILGTIDSIYIESEKSLCLINELQLFFQGEMKNGSLTLNGINSGFESVNISNSNVKSKLNFSKDCKFSINADMRYCLLKQEHLTLEEIVSPNSILYSGNYGTAKHQTSNLSIISTYGDVSIIFN